MFELAERKWKEVGKYECHVVEPRYFGDYVRSAKEIIFDREDDKPVFHFVMFMFDASSFEVHIERAFKTASPLSDDDVRKILALALVEDVPVVPNTPSVAPRSPSFIRRCFYGGSPQKTSMARM